MLFNSLDFAIFLPLVFLVYWLVPHGLTHLRNMVVLVASYIFYGWWDPRFLLLIAFSTVVDYTTGRLMGTAPEHRRKPLLIVSLVVNLGLLCYFKYSNFFLDQFEGAFSLLGSPISVGRLDIILPVGISFYTFQTMSYSIDVYRRTIPPQKDFLAFAAYVAFFPQLVAGPIERAASLLPQFGISRTFSYAAALDGSRQILWGFFKKLVIADNCAAIVEQVFSDHDAVSGSTLLMGIVFFSFQVYGDFSGYSDIAIGTARLFGFNLMQNFAFPYFSRDIAEFWRRWHISLSTWFRDYLYVPIGGSRGTRAMTIRNIFILFVVSGFWHGASWNFVIWGFLHAVFFLPLLLWNRNRRHLGVVAENRALPTLREVFEMGLTFLLFNIALVVFRSRDMPQAISYLSRMLSPEVFSRPQLVNVTLLLLCTLFMIIEWIGRRDQYAIENMMVRQPRIIRWSFLASLIVIIGLFMHPGEAPFIYFQF